MREEPGAAWRRIGASRRRGTQAARQEVARRMRARRGHAPRPPGERRGTTGVRQWAGPRWAGQVSGPGEWVAPPSLSFSIFFLFYFFCNFVELIKMLEHFYNS